MKYDWLKCLRGLYPSHDVYVVGGVGSEHTFRFIEPEPVEVRPRKYVDINLSDEILIGIESGDRLVCDFVMRSIETAEKHRFPAPENDHG